MNALFKSDWISLYSITTNDSPRAYVVEFPTGNCQICSISLICNILDRGNIEAKKWIKKILIEINIEMVLIDIQKKYEKSLELIFNEQSIVFKKPYISTNGSGMIMYLLKTQEVKNW